MRRRDAHEAEDRAARLRTATPKHGPDPEEQRPCEWTKEEAEFAREWNAREKARRVAKYEKLLADPRRVYAGRIIDGLAW